jgi:lysophospholipase L1-like esterase
MLVVAKAALAPVLLAQGRRLRKTALRLPEAHGARAGVEQGPCTGVTDDPHAGSAPSTPSDAAPLRLLFVGDSSAAGVGVAHQREALAQPTAQHLARLAGRAVHWQLVARSGVNTREALELLRDSAPRAADVVITALGVNDVTSQTPARRFAVNVVALLDEVARLTGARLAVICGLPPMHRLPAAPQPLRWYLGQCAHRLDRALAALCRGQSTRTHVSLQWAEPGEMAIDRFHPGPTQYRRWSALVAQRAFDMLNHGQPIAR